MNVYEICILNEDRRTTAFIEATHMSDYAAIRSACKLASGHAVEVWRDLECIYQEPADKEPADNSDRQERAA
jgi:hypothetical protein